MASELRSPVSVTEPTPPSPTSRRNQSKSRSRSRPARRRRESSPTPSSPPGLPTPAFSPEGQSEDEEIVEENTLFPLDPRRITPTLHASLVSEILSLRREVESKTKAIDTLEQSLDETRTECETLGSRLSQSTREVRSLKHQLKLLEGGTSSAMTELVRERDDAVENISDVRKKLESAQKRIRHREDEIERTQLFWDRDREAWENERRNMERKIHVVEGRLKTVLNEVAAAQEAGTLASQHSREEQGKDKNKESDTASLASSSRSRRRHSMSSVTTEEGEDEEPQLASAVRFSVMSMVPEKVDSSLNLAQELALDEDEEEFASEEDAPVSPEALPEERPMSVLSSTSRTVASKAQRILGMTMSNTGSPTVAEYPSHVNQFPANVEYRDSAVQYSPPPSPELSAKPEDIPLPTDESQDADLPVDENRYVPKVKDSATLTMAIETTSSSCQTVDLPDIPWTPKAPDSPVTPEPAPVQMTSASTQTDSPMEPAPEGAEKPSLSPNAIPAEVDVPMIAIHPPGSEPSSPRNSVVLPPQTKSVSVQTNFRNSIEERSIAIQTEEIRIDQRPVKLPASLLPSAIPDLPTSAEIQEANELPYRAPVPPPRSAKREQLRKTQSEGPVKPPRASGTDPMQAYPGNNDNGPLSDDAGSGLRRPFRSSSLFAGFEQLSDDEGPSGEERDIFTDEEFLHRPFTSYTLRRGKMVNAKSRPSQDEMTLSEIDEQLSDAESRPSDAGRGASRATQRSFATSSSGRQPGIRKMALISSGAAAHHKTRPRSPSEPSIDSGSVGSSIAPPFPVPTRHSSRKIPLNGSDGPPSPTRSTGRQFSDRSVRSSMIRPSLRRVQSENTISECDGVVRPETCSTPTRSPTSFTPDSPAYLVPPLPLDDITAPREMRQPQPHGHHRPSVPSMNWGYENEDSTGGVQPTSVVDAIAQTMVGEWMFKYVRRRKSFGMGDSKDNWEGKNADEVSANITNSGVRHKRWVWLAPYEGSIMWSSKQPTSGPALLGKSGRKCKNLIISLSNLCWTLRMTPHCRRALDILNPFNRSILVLTPQRALKFTALTAERHYVWLTALSFLSHSSMALSDLATIPPAPREENVSRPPAHAALRRNPIRDSIRVAKGRPRPVPKGKRSFPEPAPEVARNDSIDMAADAPTIPRYSYQNQHTRKRSNTAPRPPALHTLRSFSSQGTMPSPNNSTTVGSDIYTSPVAPPSNLPPNLPAGINSVRSSISRASDTSARPSVNSNVFDMGTMRMEAFIDTSAGPPTRPPPPPPTHRAPHVRKTSSVWSQTRYSGYAPSVDSELSFRPDDPFRGF
ncbi:hypothetical protein N7468_005696 [Penicillium chermesinum]|uniref:Pleckstrin homology domain-containing protein n=1 Tax=Penicillium chermesinum TaxID=63820 RepID=A0A9W9P0B6_9EURO|nr:uncharacterized protein N7468_005696 [Penicillium chermesinum]KAJ5232740.1 hypothetical protein N7468_005696 [Penicillium chermesinum]